MTRVRAVVHPGLSRKVAPLWCRLEARARPQYFSTWGWVEHWLEALPAERVPELVALEADGEIVAAGFFGRRATLRRGFVPTRTVSLNATGDLRFDDLCIEHNALLVDPSAPPISLADLVRAVPEPWDEIFLPALAAREFPGAAAREHVDGVRVVVERELPAPYVDLTRVRARGDYLALLSSSTRTHVRQARRAFGALDVEVAADVPRALSIFEELAALSRERWRDTPSVSSFEDAWFTDFHRRLIAKRFATGELELLRITAGTTLLGCLYNFVKNGHVLFYQGAFAAFDAAHKRPGYVAHAAAVERAARAGHDDYDFLGGTSSYKASLSTDARTLVWVRLQRPHLRFAVEAQLRAWNESARAELRALRQRLAEKTRRTAR